MDPGAKYTASVYVKTDRDDGGTVTFRFYTADNSEAGRLTSPSTAITAADGWTRATWSFENPSDSEADSLSFTWSGLTAPSRLWLAAPQLEAGNRATPYPACTCAEIPRAFTRRHGVRGLATVAVALFL